MRERPQTESHDVLKTDAKYLQTIGKQHCAIKHKLFNSLCLIAQCNTCKGLVP